MDGVVLIGALVLTALIAVMFEIADWSSREQCPEREPDLSDEDRAYLRDWTQSNRWEE